MDESFGDDFVLPPDRAYSETCAGVGSIMFSWRMLLADGDARYADLIERTLYNVVATSPSDDGRSFFYANTLHQRVPGTVPDPAETSPRASASLRAPWFEVSCCPPNVARTLASLDAYVAAASDDGIRILQYAPATIRTRLPSGTPVTLSIDTRYPADGVVRVTIETDAAFTLGLRVPAWAAGAELRLIPADGQAETEPASPGTVQVARSFRRGDVIELTLPMAPRITRPDPRIDAARGCVAVERGPEVLALESVDLGAAGMSDVEDAVFAGAPPVDRDGRVWIGVRQRGADDAPWPYTGATPTPAGTATEVPLVPYHSWGNRGPSTMRVWIPTQ
jgi:DUF1680 family protein